MRRPEPTEHLPYFSRYIDRVPETDIVSAMETQGAETERLLRSIGDEQSLYRYAPGKWSIREMVVHVTDAERVFSYRAVAFGRGDESPLPSFDENPWMATSGADSFPFSLLVDALVAVRRSSLLLFRTMPPEAWDRTGTASGALVSVRALAYISVGHERHHVAGLKERYLSR